MIQHSYRSASLGLFPESNMAPEIEETIPGTSCDLLQRWPDHTLLGLFRELLILYQTVTQAQLDQGLGPPAASRGGFEAICDWIQEAVGNSPREAENGKGSEPPEKTTVRSLVLNLRQSYGSTWLQGIASLLGMLMHFSSGKRGSNLLLNERRPHKLFSTYPTCPAVARFAGETVIAELIKDRIPRVCHRFQEAERYADCALRFRVLDPAMESGQFLLEVALASLRKVHRVHSPHSKTAQYLSRALLEKLCRDCLWGIDRNELARKAVSLLFSLLGAEFGTQQLGLSHLLTADALECFAEEQLPLFDAIVSNPPWGEKLTRTNRAGLRAQFSTIEHHSDTYVAFTELAVRSLQPGGVFALILPSQVVATRNAAGLRQLFLSETQLDRMILLPRAAFADATVRGLVLVGRKACAERTHGCAVTIYPIVKKLSDSREAHSLSVSFHALRHAGEGSWWPLLSNFDSGEFVAPSIRLEQIATVASGIQVYGKGRGIPPQTADVIRKRPFTLSSKLRGAVPAIRGRDVHDFQLGGPTRFVKFGKWLARVGDHDGLRHSRRIFVREICRRDGKLNAAMATDGLIPLHGVLTVVPVMIDPYALVGILNSSAVAEYVRTHTASYSKVDFQKITITELQQMPIPVSAISPPYRTTMRLSAPTPREASFCRRLRSLARELSCTVSVNEPKVQKLRLRLDGLISAMYGLGEEAGNE
jgi:hypothetical protein